MSSFARRLVLIVLAGVAVFAGFSIYADASEIAGRLTGFDWWAFAAGCGLAVVNYAIRFGRWSLYLAARDIEVPTRISGLIFLSGFALSITPGKIGEFIKSYLLRVCTGVAMARSASIVVAERVTDLIAMLILAVIGVALYGMARSMVVAGAGVIATGLLFLSWRPAGQAAIGLVARLGPLRRLAGRLELFYDGVAELMRPRPLAWATALSVPAWMAECVGFAVIVSAFPGTDVPLGLATLIYAATTVAGALSFLPGGILVTEATMILFLVQASRGVDEPTAVAATILTRLATLWLAVLFGVVALAVLHRAVPATRQSSVPAGKRSGAERAGRDGRQLNVQIADSADTEK